MNATDLLAEDNQRIRELFDAFRDLDAGDQRGKRELFERIAGVLERHARLEEEIFYPAVRALRTEDAEEITLEAFEEHKIAQTLVAQIRSLPKGDPLKDAKMKVLMESVEHHIEEEEDEIFSEAGELVNERLEEFGDRLEALEIELGGEIRPEPLPTGVASE